MNIITKKFDLGDGRMIEIETGKLAKQADALPRRFLQARGPSLGA